MQRFRGGGAMGSDVGAGEAVGPRWVSTLTAAVSKDTCFGRAGSLLCRRSIVISGSGGLGVFVRAGLVKPVSLVRSAVDAMLMLLVMDRRRARPFEMECKGVCEEVCESSSCVLSIALVRLDCSLGRLMFVFKKLAWWRL
jgi:hypothetical protein